MSIDKSIRELIATATASGESLVSVENVTLARMRLDDLIAAALADARREGAEQMRSELNRRAQAQKPVAWMPYWGLGRMIPHPFAFIDKSSAELIASQIKSNTEVRPLYAHPVPAIPAGCGACGDACKPHLRERLSAAKMQGDELRARLAEIERLKRALKMAVTQNECDMLLTGEELRECRKALGVSND